jgi:hypothetical protein
VKGLELEEEGVSLSRRDQREKKIGKNRKKIEKNRR